MSIYIKSIHINKLFHLSDFDINVSADGKMRHLILTGPNGTGKTLLLNAIADYLDVVSKDSNLNFLDYEEQLNYSEKRLATAKDNAEKVKRQKSIEWWQSRIEALSGKVRLELNDVETMPKAVADKQFLLAYYGDQRRSEFKEIRNPEKPDLKAVDIRINKVGEFIKFLVDLKVQRALADGENAKNYVEEIEAWFETFQNILRRLFEDDNLVLEFDFRSYSFFINTLNKRFKFTELSAGYSAALDIIVDLILKMQGNGNLKRTFDMPGIVMIDEIETHLHLKMQREILPMLVALFPKVQFVVTTHSPFVLSSLSDAVAYDLLRHAEIDDLTNYSYDALAEGYFGVDMASGKLQDDIERFEYLVQKESLNLLEKDELSRLKNDFEKIPDAVAPVIKDRYYAAVATMPNKGKEPV